MGTFHTHKEDGLKESYSSVHSYSVHHLCEEIPIVQSVSIVDRSFDFVDRNLLFVGSNDLTPDYAGSCVSPE